MLGSDRLKRIKDQGEILFNSPILKNLSKVERYEFLQLCHRRTYHQGEYIYYQGDPGGGMYFIESGGVQLVTDIDREEESVRQTLGPADSFGLFPVKYEFKRFTSARCTREAILLGFFKSDLETLKKRYPQIAVNFMETLAETAMSQVEILMDELGEVLGAKRLTELQIKAFYQSSNV